MYRRSQRNGWKIAFRNTDGGVYQTGLFQLQVTESQFELVITKRGETSLIHVNYSLFSFSLNSYLSLYILVLVFEKNNFIKIVTDHELLSARRPRSLQNLILRGQALFGNIIRLFSVQLNLIHMLVPQNKHLALTPNQWGCGTFFVPASVRCSPLQLITVARAMRYMIVHLGSGVFLDLSLCPR